MPKLKCCHSTLLVLLFAASFSLKGEALTYSFTDPGIQEGDLASVFVGDIISGEVSIDTATGDYSVIWVASSQSHFMPPLQFILNLGNASLGMVVSLSTDYSGVSLTETYSYSGNEPGLMEWLAGDLVVTSGSALDYGLDFQSGIFSLFPGLTPELGSDLLVHSAILDGGVPLPPLQDSDGDGLTDDIDPFPESHLEPTVILLGVDSGVPNSIPGIPTSESGTTLADVIITLEQEAADEAKNHGDYVARFGKDLKNLERDGWISGRQRAELHRIAAPAAN